jgi:hypothetical protein
MNKKFLSVVCGILTIIPAFVYGAVDTSGVKIDPFNTGNTASPITGAKQIFVIIGGIVVWIYRAFFVVAVIFLLIAAYNYLQGGTNPEKIKTAKGQIKYAVISIVIALVSTGVSLIIAQFLSSGGAF